MIQYLSKNESKKISALKLEKYRNQNKQFIVEGEKLLKEAINSQCTINSIIIEEQSFKNRIIEEQNRNVFIANQEQMKKLSSFVTPPAVMAVIKMPDWTFTINELKRKITIVLEDIMDPGNLGTIIRMADWFGIENVICSSGSVEVFNQKVIQASMGAIFHVKVHYTTLETFLDEARQETIPVIGTFLEGENIYTMQLPESGILLMGNESRGISPEIISKIDKKITIPSFNFTGNRVESLNVAIATAIICSEWNRKLKY
jgi:TrmH family RNA methyltransferase